MADWLMCATADALRTSILSWRLARAGAQCSKGFVTSPASSCHRFQRGNAPLTNVTDFVSNSNRMHIRSQTLVLFLLVSLSGHQIY